MTATTETHKVETFTATIWVGLRHGYTDVQHDPADAVAIVQEYVNEVGLGVTVTPTTFVYVDGTEPGVAVGLINYPRFPSTTDDLRLRAFSLAELLREGLDQHRVSIVFPDCTVMIGPKQMARHDGTVTPAEHAVLDVLRQGPALLAGRTAAMGDVRLVDSATTRRLVKAGLVVLNHGLATLAEQENTDG